MKKISSIVMLATVVSLARAADTIQLDSTNMVGMTCFNSSLGYLPIGVTYGDYATTNVDMSVTNLIWTGNLNVGDVLSIYDYSQGVYRGLVLIAGKKWKAVKVDGKTPIDPGVDCFQLGRGAWLTRQGIANRSDKNVYTFGQVPVGIIQVEIQPGTGTKATSTLISFPRSEPFDVNGGAIDWTEIALSGDVLRVPQENGKMKDYQWNVSTGKWYVITGGKVVTTGLVVPRGVGFWYSRGAKNTTGATLTWNVGNL